MRVEDRPVGTGGFGVSVDELYRRHAREALHVARSITRNRDDAADAVAEAFAGVFEAMAAGREHLAEPEIFRAYFLSATRNAAIDIVRRAGRLTATDQDQALDGAATGAGPSDRLVAGEDRALVAEAYAELPPRWRAVLWLTEVEDMAPREAAPLLHLTPNNVAQLAVRARSRLRERYVQMHVRNHASGDCLDTTEHLGGLVAGELTTTQSNRVRGHLAECASCRQRLGELDDIGLVLRRAAIPLPALALHRFRRWRWPWSARRHAGTAPGGARHLTTVDPSVPATIVNLVTSPGAQQVVGSVVAGLLVLGAGTAVVRRNDRPPPETRPVAPAPAPALTPVPTTLADRTTEELATTSTTSTTSTTTVAPATATSVAPAATSARPAPFSPRGPLSSAGPSVVAEALVPALAVHDGPGGAPTRSLANPRISGAPLVLLVTAQQAGWLEVLLPVRPNGSRGWVRSDQVRVATHDFRIVVELGAHRITAYRGTEVILSEPVGVGTADAPTPGGLYYVTELFQPLDAAGNLYPNGPYGPYAYGLSGFSEVLFDFGGGDGQFGIHGTNDPSGLGRDVSHGCIRMSNEGITRLAGMLPLGVPVEILS